MINTVDIQSSSAALFRFSSMYRATLLQFNIANLTMNIHFHFGEQKPKHRGSRCLCFLQLCHPRGPSPAPSHCRGFEFLKIPKFNYIESLLMLHDRWPSSTQSTRELFAHVSRAVYVWLSQYLWEKLIPKWSCDHVFKTIISLSFSLPSWKVATPRSRKFSWGSGVHVWPRLWFGGPYNWLKVVPSPPGETDYFSPSKWLTGFERFSRCRPNFGKSSRWRFFYFLRFFSKEMFAKIKSNPSPSVNYSEQITKKCDLPRISGMWPLLSPRR